jgi:hypothetical protein
VTRVEVWSDYTLTKRVFCGYFKNRKNARKFVCENYPDIGCDCIAVDDEIIMGNDEW